MNELVDTPPAEKNHRNDDKDDSGLTSRSPSSSPLDDAPGVEGDVLPWLPVPAPSAHPHHSRRVLQQFLTDLRRAPSPFSSSSSALPAPPPPPHERQTAERKKNGGKEKMPPKPVRSAVVPRQRVPILQQSGYLICLLPRTYHPLDEMLCTLRRRGRVRRGPLASPGSFEESLDEVVDAVEGALSDMVVQAFASPFPHDGAAQWYDLIQLKRYPLSLQSSVSGPTTIPPLPPRAKEMGRGLAGESSPIQLSPQDIGWAYLSASVMRAMGDGNDGMMMMMGAHHHHHHKNNHNHADQQKVVWERCHQLFSQWRASIPLQWVDLLVFKKKAATATTGGDSTSLHPSMRRGTGTGTAVAGSAELPPPYVAPVQWEDSLEYDEYLPAEFPTQHHWIDAVPTYSYLEDDFIPPGRRQRPLITGGDLLPQPPHRLSSVSHLPEANVLAHGPLTVEKIRRVTVSSSPSSRLEKQNEIDGDRGSEDQEDDDAVPVSAWKADADAASAMFHTIFREELRKKRSHKKFRHMALSSSRDQQEWYIDEKLIKSEAAKVELMNQLARFDFQQNFDH